ncbi:hypothetical protein EJB05_41919 [Eragrostis curvula]|uniref:Uncharacterized protein n=1 Tax=Eragrostis curvula TaxID=38414 RepID=A0A5J9TAZ2_9POAL|nr:hypothetical protein EJB05_41919 [Eragrostis curvula]
MLCLTGNDNRVEKECTLLRNQLQMTCIKSRRFLPSLPTSQVVQPLMVTLNPLFLRKMLEVLRGGIAKG